jgi:hypothetical protein
MAELAPEGSVPSGVRGRPEIGCDPEGDQPLIPGLPPGAVGEFCVNGAEADGAVSGSRVV